VPVYEIGDFVKGKKTGRHRRAKGLPQRVTVVTRDEINPFLGARNPRERDEHLRWLRDQGKLIAERGRLTQRVRCGYDMLRRYVFKGPADAVPKLRKRPKVMTWR
jgi:hypothetical protein